MRYTVVFLCIFLFFIPVAVNAQEISLGLSPLQHHIKAKPGAKITFPFTIKNYGDATLVTLEFTRLESADSRGNYTLTPIQELETPEPQLTISTLGEEPFLLLANEEISDTVIAEIPAETPEKDYYYTLLLRSNPSQGFETSSSIKLHASVAAPILISITKNGHLKASISNPQLELENNIIIPFLKTNRIFLDINKDIKGSLIIENKGKNATNVTSSTLIKPTYSLTNFKPYTKEMPATYVFAYSRRIIPLTDFLKLPPGAYVLTTAVSDGLSTKSQSISIIIFPFRYTVYFTALLFLAFIVWLGYKRYTNT